MSKSINVGLVKGRHEMGDLVSDYIFKGPIEDPTDFGKMWLVADGFIGDLPMDVKEINLYVTGLTAALAEVIKVCRSYDIKLNLFHFDTKTNTYVKQEM